jgi:nucleoid-associated protein EbfC
MDIRGMMKQAQKVQQKMMDAQKTFNEKEFEITAGGGAIALVMKGDYSVKSLKIDKGIISPDDSEGLEDLITSAVNQAVETVRSGLEKEMGALSGSLGLPPGLGF